MGQCRPRSLSTAIVGWCALCFSILSAVASLPDGSFPSSFGTNIHFTQPRQYEMEQLASTGLKWVRMDFSWASIETAKGVYDFTSYDVLVGALLDHNMSAIFILDYMNPLYDGGLSPYTEEGRRAFSSWAANATLHFAGKGIVWEVYNEPNINVFWHPSPNATNYALLAKAASAAIKEATPSEIVVAPATSCIDFDYLDAIFSPPLSLLDSLDGVSVHPYRDTPPETAMGDWQQLRALVEKYAKGRHIPLLSSEWGYSSLYPGWDRETQAKVAVRMFLVNAASNVSLSIWYDWQNDGTDYLNLEHHFGLVFNPYLGEEGRALMPKPSFHAVQTAMAVLDGYRFVERVDAGDDDAYVFHLQASPSSGRTGMLAVWTPNESRIPLKTTFKLPLSSPKCVGVTSMFGDALPALCPDSSMVVTFPLDNGVVFLGPF
uniref:Glycoside hydrolase family 5 domain-containing protein n=1 Tax=Palpitomonas bilix TaxID=652834 RepID=A0A7S3GK93_9EUKA